MRAADYFGRKIMEIKKTPKSELEQRMNRFTAAMNAAYADWEVCAITGGVGMYYLTGTICDGMALIRRDKDAALWARKSYERAVLESEFGDIRRMTSFRDVAAAVSPLPDTLYLDMASATLEWYGLLSKYIKFERTLPIDSVMLGVRAVKSPYEIAIMRRAGSVIDRLLREELPGFLQSGMSEADLGAELLSLFIKNGYHGVSRFSMRNADVVLGHVGFGVSPLYPSIFNGASGIAGLCPAVPVLGSRDVRLKAGDLIYIDIGFGLDGYNVDKTLIFSFCEAPPEHVRDAHGHCLELEKLAVSMMRPGAKPSDIYNSVLQAVRPELRGCFMGAPGRTVNFLGHGVGLYVDELPVLAKGFDQPLECGMTIAVEPKISVEGIGLTGSENTYLITESGAESLTGEQQEIIICMPGTNGLRQSSLSASPRLS
jgi:Xaa-Pro aminopeptidase